MANSVPQEGSSLPSAGLPPPEDEEARPGTLERLSSFRVTYLAIFVFLLLYVFTVRGVEGALRMHFQSALAEAVQVDPASGPVIRQIRSRVREVVQRSPWVRVGRIQAEAFVLGADGTPIYFAGSGGLPPPEELDPKRTAEEARRLLPARATAFVAVPHNSLLANAILVGYAAILLSSLFFANRAVERRQAARVAQASQARDAAAQRAARIEAELEGVRDRLGQVGARDAAQMEEVRVLQSERSALGRKLEELARREEELLAKAAHASELDSERETLEELLEEAVRDLSGRDQEIETLQSRLKRAARGGGSGGRSRSRELEQTARRMRTLYKNVEWDDKALRDLLALRDEAMKLKAEEAVKRLSDEADNAAVRRKVGGLPSHLNIFELGFAGKGRIYYTHGSERRFRIVTVGAKNSQKPDLEYLSRL